MVYRPQHTASSASSVEEVSTDWPATQRANRRVRAARRDRTAAAAAVELVSARITGRKSSPELLSCPPSPVPTRHGYEATRASF